MQQQWRCAGCRRYAAAAPLPLSLAPPAAPPAAAAAGLRWSRHRAVAKTAAATTGQHQQQQRQLQQARPRSPLDPQHAAPHLRRFLAHAAAQHQQHQPQPSADLQQLLSEKLGATPPDLQRIFENSSSSSTAGAGGGGAGGASLREQAQQLQELAEGLDALLGVGFSQRSLLGLLQATPALLSTPLSSWCAFFERFGFTPRQVHSLISQTRGEVLTKGDLVTAGDAIMHLRQLGFDADEVRHRVVAHTPQVLAMQAADIELLIRLWGKFSVGVDERAGM